MKLARFLNREKRAQAAIVHENELEPLAPSAEFPSLDAILAADDVAAAATRLATGHRVPISEARLLAPIDQQEVWAAGVTYKRSQVARMEESQGSASVYDKVYSAPRPELFFKALPHRVRGPGEALRIRADSAWNVPEPELALVLDPRLRLVGFTVGNDMSSRDIEGENPLYLPQAKVYDACCGLGPWVTLAAAMPAIGEIGIRLAIKRASRVVFEGQTSAGQIARTFEDLIAWLGRDNSFPGGAVLLTGTGIVPGDDFTLQAGDHVSISIDGIGTLENTIVQGPG